MQQQQQQQQQQQAAMPMQIMQQYDNTVHALLAYAASNLSNADNSWEVQNRSMR